MAHQFGDVVLVPFPFTDQSAAKQRPGVVVSSLAYHRARRDLILMPITSQVRGSGEFGEVIVQDWQSAGLLKPSAVKPVLATFERSLVRKTLGRLSARDQQRLRESITSLFG
jgi:mRNA interferase MazF